MHTKKREVQFDFDLNEDVLLNMKDKLDTAWDNYMDSMQVFDTNLEGKEGKACKYVLTNKYYLYYISVAARLYFFSFQHFRFTTQFVAT